MTAKSDANAFAVVIVARGTSVRMKSKDPKVLHVVAGKPILSFVLHAAMEVLGPQHIFTVVQSRPTAFESVVKKAGANLFHYPEQGQLGALRELRERLQKYESVMVLSGDTPLLQQNTIRRLFDFHVLKKAAMTIVTAEPPDPFGYSRVFRTSPGSDRVKAIIEQRALSRAQNRAREVHSGISIFRTTLVFQILDQLSSEQSRSLFFGDLASLFIKARQTVLALKAGGCQEVLGIATRADLAYFDSFLRKRKCLELMTQGVTIYKPEACVIDGDVIVGEDTVIDPFTQLLGKTKIGAGCHIRSYSVVSDAIIPEGATVVPHYTETGPSFMVSTPTLRPHGTADSGWKFFVSYAREDIGFVRPLVAALRSRGVSVWFDEVNLKVGDSLRRSIENGLSLSEFGIVVLSPAYFSKEGEWPQVELDGLVSKEIGGKKVILPVWHNVSRAYVRARSHVLADRVPVSSSSGLETVVEKLLAAIE